jgi:secretion/DNA translocation related TadE-like protein
MVGTEHPDGAVGPGIRGRTVRDDGVATVVACVCAMVLLIVTGAAMQLGAALLARHRAEIAADLSALAGAAELLQGRPAACGQATTVARANGAAVATCTLDGVDLLVTVTVSARFGPLSATASGRARAGPVDPAAR